MSSPFFLVLKNTFQKEYRSKSLIFLSIFTVALILILNSTLKYFAEEFLSKMGTGASGDMAFQGMIYLLNLWTYFLGIILGVNTIKTDQESGVQSQLLSFPLERHEYIFARLLGTWSITAIYYLFSVAFAGILFSSTAGEVVGGVNDIISVILSLFTIFTAICFSAFFSLYLPKVISLVLTVFLWVFISAANNVFGAKSYGEIFSELSGLKTIGVLFHTFFPRVGSMGNISLSFLFDKDHEYSLLLEFSHYGIMSALFLGMFIFLFRNREI